MPVIVEAKKRGYYICTCDYLPDNPGHRLADEYHNVSTTDYEGVLKLAERIQPDQVVAYASDPSAPIAAYVAEKMGLPGNPYASVQILGEKDLFRKYMLEHGFRSPQNLVFDCGTEVEELSGMLSLPAILKPTDSCGSKGVALINSMDDLRQAIPNAKAYSRNGRLILEEFIDNEGGDIHGDGFVLDGELVFHCLGDHLYNEVSNPFNPKGTTWPTTLTERSLREIVKDAADIIRGCGFRNGPVNIEARVNSKGYSYVMEIGPRSGGFFVPQAIYYASGFDMVAAILDSLEGKPISLPSGKIAPTAYYAIHSSKNGRLKGISLAESLAPYLIESHYYKERGEEIIPYTGGNAAIGVLLLGFGYEDEMRKVMADIDNLVRVEVE
ncbi:MAG TPA: ATP-grasp domain-containing protein [Candidatus Cloacimonadota bacterium]|nr:ATP-grasp domain-containing protein [Candidatus Cloacimonadota bacterium]